MPCCDAPRVLMLHHLHLTKRSFKVVAYNATTSRALLCRHRKWMRFSIISSVRSGCLPVYRYSFTPFIGRTSIHNQSTASYYRCIRHTICRGFLKNPKHLAPDLHLKVPVCPARKHFYDVQITNNPPSLAIIL